ncbi:PD-(D/E)XK nuclease family protein [Paraburkholderia dipogonis]|uniref:PD-(D/E)XK nuclease family protein n=1 Tax=Paraburkholderia dipogonis TaxID=1211383 RepID=UPI0038BCB341
MSEFSNFRAASSPEVLGVVRASSWKTLFSCPLSWYYANVEKIRSASSGIAQIGTAIHAGTALFDGPRLRGDSISVEEAVEGAIAVLYDDDAEVNWDSSAQFKAAEAIVARSVNRYCHEIAPKVTYTAVEARCEDLHINTKYGTIVTTGTIDRVRERMYLVEDDGTLTDFMHAADRQDSKPVVFRENVRDIKTGLQAVGYDDEGGRVATIGAHHLQVGIYTIMTEVELQRPMDAPAEICGISTGKSGDIAVSDIRDVRTALLGTEERPGMIELAAKMLKDGDFRPAPGTVMCSPLYCSGWNRCPYHA